MKYSEKMLQDMALRNYCRRTINSYVYLTGRFFVWFGKPPAQATREDVRRYLLHLVNEEGLSQSTYGTVRAALKFFFEVTLGKPCAIERTEVCKYFARYTHRVGISNKRIVSASDGRVTFLARHRAKDGTYLGQREVTLSAHAFLRRFLLHTLPRNYTRIRHYGLTAPINVRTLLPLARSLVKESAAAADAPEANDDRSDPPPDTSVCPECGGRMLVLRVIHPQRTGYFDTS